MPQPHNHKRDQSIDRSLDPSWELKSPAEQVKALESIRSQFGALHHGTANERELAVRKLSEYYNILPKSESEIRGLILESFSALITEPRCPSILSQVAALRYLLATDFDRGVGTLIEISSRSDLGPLAGLAVSDIFDLGDLARGQSVQPRSTKARRFIELVEAASPVERIAVADLLLRYQDATTKQHVFATLGARLLAELAESKGDTFGTQISDLQARYKREIDTCDAQTRNGLK